MKEVKIVIDTGGTPINNLTVYVGQIDDSASIKSRIETTNNTEVVDHKETKVVENNISKIVEESIFDKVIEDTNHQNKTDDKVESVNDAEPATGNSDDLQDKMNSKRIEISKRVKGEGISDHLKGGTNV